MQKDKAKNVDVKLHQAKYCHCIFLLSRRQLLDITKLYNIIAEPYTYTLCLCAITKTKRTGKITSGSHSLNVSAEQVLYITFVCVNIFYLQTYKGNYLNRSLKTRSFSNSTFWIPGSS